MQATPRSDEYVAEQGGGFAEAGTDYRVEKRGGDQGCPAVGKKLLHYLIALYSAEKSSSPRPISLARLNPSLAAAAE